MVAAGATVVVGTEAECLLGGVSQVPVGHLDGANQAQAGHPAGLHQLQRQLSFNQSALDGAAVVVAGLTVEVGVAAVIMVGAAVTVVGAAVTVVGGKSISRTKCRALDNLVLILRKIPALRFAKKNSKLQHQHQQLPLFQNNGIPITQNNNQRFFIIRKQLPACILNKTQCSSDSFQFVEKLLIILLQIKKICFTLSKYCKFVFASFLEKIIKTYFMYIKKEKDFIICF